MNEAQLRAWQALGLGPRWQSRGPAEAIPAPVVAPAPLAPVVAPAPQTLVGTPAPVAPALKATSDPAIAWQALADEVASCTACGLCAGRRQTVFGTGSRTGPWMLVGEAPGAEEDERGEPFVGQAGRLLDHMLDAVGRSRARDVFIANTLKCRPPGNRNPEPGELARCLPFLHRQIALVAPRLLLLMGRYAAQSLLQTTEGIGALRGRVHTLVSGGRDIPVVVTYHPAYLLRTPLDKARAWQDLCLARSLDT